MKKLYDTLKQVLEQVGYNIASWGADEFETDERSLRLEVVEQSQIEPSFCQYSATFTVTFLNGDWAENATLLSNSLMSLIPVDERPNTECEELPDNTHLMTLLEVPQFSDIICEYNEDTAEEEHSVTVTIFYQD